MQDSAPTFGVRCTVSWEHVGILKLGDVEQTDAESHVVHDLCAYMRTHTHGDPEAQLPGSLS